MHPMYTTVPQSIVRSGLAPSKGRARRCTPLPRPPSRSIAQARQPGRLVRRALIYSDKKRLEHQHTVNLWLCLLA